MKLKKFSKNIVGKILLVVMVTLLALMPCNMTYASGKASRVATKSVKHSHHGGKKSTKNAKATKGKKHNKRKKHGKHRCRHGRARYVSSAESPAQKKKIADIAAELEANPDLSGDLPELSADSYVWPIHYGYIARGVGGGHAGADMMSRAGEPVYAVADGIVTFVSVDNPTYRGYGKMCVISHQDRGTTSLYSHCGAIYVRVGQIVKRGQKIAIVGRTGLTTTNHLHFEIKKNGRRLNPERVLPQEGALGHRYVPH